MDTKTDIESTALDWLMRQDAGELSPAVQVEFDQWLSASTRHRVTFLRLQAAWTRADRLKRLRPLDGSIDENLLESPRPRWPARLRSASWALAGTMAVSVAAIAWFTLYPIGWNDYDTAVGSSERVILRDGSTVTLNTDSKLRVRLTRERREVVLLQGEALFDVAHDSQRPFDVKAGATRIRAVGTAFSVRLRGRSDVEVLVAEGRVAIDPPEADLRARIDALPPTVPMLSAGDSARVRSDALRVTKIQPQAVSRKLAWKDGRLWFDRMTLQEAVDEFNRYNRRQIEIIDPQIAALHIGGGFDTTDPDGFIEALQSSFRIRAIPDPRSSDAAVISLVGIPPE